MRSRSAVEIRPLAFGCGSFLIFSLLALTFTSLAHIGTDYALFVTRILPMPIWAIFCAGVIVAAALVFRTRRNDSAVARSVLAILLALILPSCVGWLFGNIKTDAMLSAAEECVGDGIEIRAVVLERVYYREYGSRYTVEIESIGGRSVSIRGGFTAEYDCDMAVGERFEAVANIAPAIHECESVTDIWYAVAQNELLEMTDESGSADIIGKSTALRDITSEMRRRARLKISSLIPDEDAAGFISALLTSDRSGIGDSTRRDFRLLGISHILALSGLHLSILSGLLWMLLSHLRIPSAIVPGAGFGKRGGGYIRVPKKVSSAVIIAAVCTFVVFTGMPLSVVRAGIMNICLLCAPFFRRKSDPVTSLLFAAALICTFDLSGMAVCDIGLMLSVLATLGLVFLVSRRSEGISRSRVFSSVSSSGTESERITLRVLLMRMFYAFAKYLIGSIAATAAAMLFTLPIVWAAFGYVSMISPAANLFAVPLTTAVMVLSVAALILGGVPLIGGFISLLAEDAAVLLLGSVSALARPAADLIVFINYAFTPYVFAASAVIIAAIILISRRIASRGFKHIFTVSSIAVTAVFPVIFAVCLCIWNASHAGQSTLICLNSGLNDSIVLFGADGKNAVVCDVSSGSTASAANAAAEAWSGRCASIDAWVVTHYHNLHISSFDRVSDSYLIDTLLLPSPQSEDDIHVAENLAAIAEGKGIAVTYFAWDGSEEIIIPGIGSGGARIKLAPKTYLNRSTHPVIAAKIDIGGKCVLYSGGSGFETEFVSDCADECDYLILGAHSPKTKDGIVISDSARLKGIFCASEDADALLERGDVRFSRFDGGKVTFVFGIP